MKHLNGKGVDFFFDKVKQDPDTAGLLLGNGLLAEDRFLTCKWRTGREESVRGTRCARHAVCTTSKTSLMPRPSLLRQQTPRW